MQTRVPARGAAARTSSVRPSLRTEHAGGATLPEEIRHDMEAFFRADFSGIVLHRDSARARSLGAEASTEGEHVHLAPGRWAPDTQPGRRLLAHELAHVVQQRTAAVRPTMRQRGVAVNGDATLERQADVLAARAASLPGGAASASPAVVTRGATARPAGPPVAQLFVQRKASASGWQYYSSHDTGTTFGTEEEAKSHDKKQEATSAEPGIGERTPTFYSYMHTSPTSLIGNATQGPHTMSHVAVDDAFEKALATRTLSSVFAEQVPEPSEMEGLVAGEFSKSNAKKRAMHLDRFNYDYASLHRSTTRAIKKDHKYARSRVRRMMELHPYGTYGWKGNKKASASSLAGKGEKPDIHGPSSIDNGGKWTNQEEFDAFVKKRRLLDPKG